MTSAPPSLIPFYITSTLLFSVLAIFMILMIIGQKNKQNQQEKEKLYARIEEKERTMYNISTEIHDNVSQMLNLTRMTVHMLQKKATAGQEQLIHQLSEILDNLIADVRNISHSLNTELVKDRGLVESLEKEIKWMNTSRKLACSLEITGEQSAFAVETELMIMRIAQEAMQNAIKHANASQLRVSLHYQPEWFMLEVSDNGDGFDTGNCKNGIGMQNMQQRAVLINGQLVTQSAPGKGTSVMLKVPVNHKKQPEISRLQGKN